MPSICPQVKVFVTLTTSDQRAIPAPHSAADTLAPCRAPGTAEPGGREHFAVCIYQPVNAVLGGGKGEGKPRPPCPCLCVWKGGRRRTVPQSPVKRRVALGDGALQKPASKPVVVASTSTTRAERKQARRGVPLRAGWGAATERWGEPSRVNECNRLITTIRRLRLC